MDNEDSKFSNVKKIYSLMTGIIFGELTEKDNEFYQRIFQKANEFSDETVTSDENKMGYTLSSKGQFFYNSNRIKNFDFWDGKVLPLLMSDNFREVLDNKIKNILVYETKNDINVYKFYDKYFFIPKIIITKKIDFGKFKIYYIDFDFDINISTKKSEEQENFCYLYSDEHHDYVFSSRDFYLKNKCGNFYYAKFKVFDDYDSHINIVENYNPQYLSIVPESLILEMLEKFSYNKKSKIMDFMCEKIYKNRVEQIDNFFRTRGINMCKKIDKPRSILKEWKSKNSMITKSCCSKGLLFTGNQFGFIKNSIKDNKIHGYVSNIFDSITKSIENNISIPENTYIFRGLFLEDDTELDLNINKPTSFTLNLITAINFAGPCGEEKYKNLILYYKVKKDFKCIFMDKNYGTSKFFGEEEILFPFHKEIKILSEFKLVNYTFYEIDIVDSEVSKYEIDYTIENKYDLDKIKDCYIKIQSRYIEMVFNSNSKMKKYIDKFNKVERVTVLIKEFDDIYGVTFEDYIALYNGSSEIYPISKKEMDTFTGTDIGQFICHILD